jgi:hypothetical protein
MVWSIKFSSSKYFEYKEKEKTVCFYFKNEIQSLNQTTKVQELTTRLQQLNNLEHNSSDRVEFIFLFHQCITCIFW